ANAEDSAGITMFIAQTLEDGAPPCEGMPPQVFMPEASALQGDSSIAAIAEDPEEFGLGIPLQDARNVPKVVGALLTDLGLAVLLREQLQSAPEKARVGRLVSLKPLQDPLRVELEVVGVGTRMKLLGHDRFAPLTFDPLPISREVSKEMEFWRHRD